LPRRLLSCNRRPRRRSTFTHSKSIGLIPLIGLSGALEIIATFLLLDLSFYYWHVANHRIAFLWRFHNVHHVDPDLDVTTAFRFHFVEVGLSAGFRAAQVLLVGPPLAAYVHLLFKLTDATENRKAL